MIEPYLQSIINDANSRYFGFNSDKLVEQIGAKAAQILQKRYGLAHSFAFLCGLGNTGAVGLSTARNLAKIGAQEVKVYLVGRSSDIKTQAGQKAWSRLVADKISYQQDVYSKDIDKHEVMVEALLGTGSNGKLYKRFYDLIYRLTKLKAKLVSIDNPVPGYKWDFVISSGYAKTDDSVVIDLDIPEKVLSYVGPGEVKALAVPRKHSYKNQNGQVLIIGGSEKYIGAPQLAAQACANYAGITYLYTPSNVNLDLKQAAEFILVNDSELQQTLEIVDAVLIGPGLAENYVNETLINSILRDFPQKKYVLDAGAIKLANKELINLCGQVILTPHRGELGHLYTRSLHKASKYKNLEGQLRRYAIKHHCYINLKSSISMIFGAGGEFKFNTSGNAGMAKAGTGDALAGLTAAFAAKNEPWLAVTAAAFVNGLAGELAAQKYGYNYSVAETISYQAEAIELCRSF